MLETAKIPSPTLAQSRLKSFNMKRKKTPASLFTEMPMYTAKCAKPRRMAESSKCVQVSLKSLKERRKSRRRSNPKGNHVHTLEFTEKKRVARKFVETSNQWKRLKSQLPKRSCINLRFLNSSYPDDSGMLQLRNHRKSENKFLEHINDSNLAAAKSNSGSFCEVIPIRRAPCLLGNHRLSDAVVNPFSVVPNKRISDRYENLLNFAKSVKDGLEQDQRTVNEKVTNESIEEDPRIDLAHLGSSFTVPKLIHDAVRPGLIMPTMTNNCSVKKLNSKHQAVHKQAPTIDSSQCSETNLEITEETFDRKIPKTSIKPKLMKTRGNAIN